MCLTCCEVIELILLHFQHRNDNMPNIYVPLFNPVRQVVFGERRVWKTSENSQAVAPVMSGKRAPTWKRLSWDEKCHLIVIVLLSL